MDTRYGLGGSLGDCRPKGRKYQMVKTQTESHNRRPIVWTNLWQIWVSFSFDVGDGWNLLRGSLGILRSSLAVSLSCESQDKIKVFVFYWFFSIYSLLTLVLKTPQLRSSWFSNLNNCTRDNPDKLFFKQINVGNFFIPSVLRIRNWCAVN